MAIIIKKHDMEKSENISLPQPIIFCLKEQQLSEKAISLNVPLAQKLAAVKPNRRTLRLEQCLRQVLDSLPENPVVCDIDVLFNPAYEVDVLKVLLSIGRSKDFKVVWPGKYEDNRLIYAEEGYQDYKVYDLEKYDITCVI